MKNDHAHYIPAVDYVKADFEDGTLARITRDDRAPSGWWIIPAALIGAVIIATVAVKVLG